ncbi:MAG: type II toxin-antitoxin system VapC family toxin [Pirellulaceae bacterium]|nr:type II toxin-antitoxin system VapC family toxin [Pirellulaceae bacterium]
MLGRMGRITAWRTEIRKREARVARIEHTLSPFRSLPFDDRAARRYAEIRDELETRGEVIGPYDLLIAAIALNHGLTVVTNNREFSRIDGLTVEDWTIARS